MQELIKIYEHKNQKLVNARELHEFLGNKREFTTWIKQRIKQYGFVENQDYITFDKIVKRGNGRSGATKRKEYGLMVDMAKEVSMVENNARGRQARQYFIETEKKWRQQTPIHEPSKEELARYTKQLSQYVIDLSNEKKKLKEERKQLKPKAEFADRITKAKGCVTLSQAAKELKLPYGRNTLIRELKRKGIFFKNKTEPKQEYVNRDYFRMKQVPITRNNHEDFVKLQTVVTQKGLLFLSKHFPGQQQQLDLAPTG